MRSDIDRTTKHIAEVLSDPRYSCGMDSNSVIKMIHGIQNVIYGKDDRIHIPVPVGSNEESRSIGIYDIHEHSLPIRVSGGTESLSRRSRVYNARYAGVSFDTPDSNMSTVQDSLGNTAPYSETDDSDNETVDDTTRTTNEPTFGTIHKSESEETNINNVLSRRRVENKNATPVVRRTWQQ